MASETRRLRAESLRQEDYRRAALSCFNFSFRSAARAVTLLYDRELAPAGIRSTQYSLLIVLAGYANVTINELAIGLGLDRTTLSKNLKPMIKRKLIRLEALADKRKKGLILTPAGHAMLQKCTPLWEKAQARIKLTLGDDAREIQRKLGRVARTRE